MRPEAEPGPEAATRPEAATSHHDPDLDIGPWTVDLSVDQHQRRTRARARLRWRGTDLVGVGIARLNPADRQVAEIGDELAVARALSNLANQLFVATASDIEAVTQEPGATPDNTTWRTPAGTVGEKGGPVLGVPSRRP